MDWTNWAGLVVTCFAASLLQATNGFGFAVLAVPFFLLLSPPAEAVPIIVIISLAVSLFVMPGLYRSADRGLLRRLTVGSLVALPLGIIAFHHANPTIVGTVAGTIVTGFAIVLAWLRYRGITHCIATGPRGDFAVGAVAGVATGLVGMAGPPVLIYLMLGGAPMRSVRATLIGFFALIYAATLTANAIFIGVPARDWLIALSLLPFVWVGGRLGLRVGDRMGEAAAGALALIVLGATGLYTLALAAHAALN
ncbi:MAG TPA: sulfite exporter TauE/SafE family protein [Stellaceae bacterium]|nr:sulfite exporter TauE/SafE family protein [Stellaceae bacterium]